VPEPLRVGVLVSGTGSNLQALIDACRAGAIPAEVVLVISNVPKAFALERARAGGIPAVVVDHRAHSTRAAFEAALKEALDAHRPKRGRKRTPESIKKQLAALDEKIAAADPLARLLLTQERMDLESELSSMEAGVDLTEMEEEFVKAAADYGRRKGISYAAWRGAGVTPNVLKRAGIRRGRGD